MKRVLLAVVFAGGIFSGIAGMAQNAGDFRSFQSGNWNDVNTWERYDGASWVNPAPSTPTETDGVITIQAGHSVDVNLDVSIDQTVIESTATLNVAGGFTLTINDGAGTDLQNNGTLSIAAGGGFPPGPSGTIQVNGQLAHAGSSFTGGSTTRLYFNANSTYDHQVTSNQNLPIATWDATSTCLVSGNNGNAAPGNLNQTFGHFTWNTPGLTASVDLNGALSNVNGNLSILSTGSPFVYLGLSSSTDVTINIGGDLIYGSGTYAYITSSATVTVSVGGTFSCASAQFFMNNTGTASLDIAGDFVVNSSGSFDFTFDPAGTSTVNVAGDVDFSGSIINTGGGTARFIVDGTSDQNLLSSLNNTESFDFEVRNSSSAFLFGSNSIQTGGNFLVVNLATLDFGTGYIGGSGYFTLESGATIRVGSIDAAGAIQNNNTGGNIRVTGTRTYTDGGNIIYNGSALQAIGDGFPTTSAVNLEIDNASGVDNTAGSTSIIGDLTLTNGSFNIGTSSSLDIQSNFIVTNGTIGGSNTSNLTFSGSGTMGTLTMTTGSESVNNLTISRTGDLVLGSDLTIGGTLDLTGNLDFSGQSLTITGTSIAGTGGLKSNASSNLTIGGSGFSGNIPFSGTGNQLNNLTLQSTGGATYEWGAAVTINGTLDLAQGTLNNNSGLTMGGGSTIIKGAGSLAVNSPIAVSSYNVTYQSGGATGLELPSSSTALANLTVTVSGSVNLGSAITVNGDLTLNSGTLDAGTNNFTMNGSNWTANGGNFTINAANTVTLGTSGTLTMGGTSIDGTQFGNLTINSGTTVSAPNANLNVSGTWNNQGTFTPNAGTVTFNGANQNIDPAGQPFNNVTFAGTGTKTLQGTLDANGTLTISSTLDVGSNQNILVAGSWVNNGTFVAAGGTVTFDGTDQTITSNGQNFFNLVLANSGTKTLGDALDVNGDLTVNSGVTLDVSATAYAINLAGNLVNNGTINPRTGLITFDGTTAISGISAVSLNDVTIAGNLTAPAANMNVSGDWLYTSGSFNANGGTITFTGSNKSITSGGQSFANITVNGINNLTLQDALDINGNLVLSAGTLDVGTNNQINLAGDFTASGGSFNAAAGLLVLDGTNQAIDGGGVTFNDVQLSASTTATFAGNLNLTGSWNALAGSTFSGTGTVSFTGSTTQNITSSGNSFGSVTVAGTGGVVLLDALDVNGDLTISSSLSVGANDITIAGNWDASGGTFTAGTASVTFDGGAQNITSGGNAFNNLTIAGTGSKTLQDALDVNGSITISSTLDVGTDNAVAVAGDWTNNGTFTAANGKVTFDGGGTSNVLGSATTQFYDMDVTGTTNVEIESTHSLAGTLTLVDAASAFDADGSGGAGVFTLVSTNDDPATDGRIAAIPTPANFTGNVTVQRYMSSEGGIWRYLAAPVSGLTVADWQTQFPITGNFTGADDLGGANLPSLYIYDETHTGIADSGWVAYPSSANTEPITPGVGYSTWIRASSGQVTVNQRGPINKGDFNFSVSYTAGSGATHDGWNLLGNPYPSSLDWDQLWTNGATNIDATVHMIDNANGGVYATYNASTNSGTNGGTQYIAQGQSFWVQANAASPSLTATEAMKTTGTHSFYRLAPPENYIRIALSDGANKDETLIHFFDDALPGKDKYDAYKLKNSIFNLATVMEDTANMVIQAIANTGCDQIIKLDVYNIAAGNYSLGFSELDSFTENLQVYLQDNYTGTYNLVSNGYSYPFTITADSASFGMDRFAIVFEKPDINTDLLVAADNICEQEQSAVTVQGAEAGINYYLTYNGTGVSDTLTGTGGDLLLTVAEPAAPGTYEYVVMADNGCQAIALTNNAVVEVKQLYAVTQVVGDQSCGANSLTLQAAGAPANGKYLWYNEMPDELPIAETVTGEYQTPVIDSTHTFYVAIANELGCPGEKTPVEAVVINLDIPVISMDTVDFRVYRLTSSYVQGNQWYRDGQPIQGATSNTLIIDEPGVYSVVVEQSGCTVESEVFDLDDLVTGLDDELTADLISVAPNPFVSQVEINLNAEQFNLRKTRITIYDINGSIVYFNKKLKNEYNSVDLSQLKSGIYLLSVYDGQTGVQYKLVKE